MKTICSCRILLAIASLFLVMKSRSQNVAVTSIINPCNNNGQIALSVTGITPPINYTCTNTMGGTIFIQSGVPGTTTTFTGLPGYLYQPWLNPNIWTILASNGTSSASTNASLTPAFNATVNIIPANCPALSTVQATYSGGVSPFVSVWTNTATTITYTGNPSQVSNGNYTFVATAANGCVVQSAPGYSTNITVYSNPGFTVSTGGSIANCTNGTASVTAISGGVAPFSYLWNNSAVTSNISGLTRGSYNCIVTGANGCQTTAYYYVPQAITINFNTSPTNATCLQNNGSALGFPVGGTSPYTFF